MITPRHIKHKHMIKTVHIKVIYAYNNISVFPPTLPYITWRLIWDLKTKKCRDPKMKKEDPNIHISKRKNLYII